MIVHFRIWFAASPVRLVREPTNRKCFCSLDTERGGARGERGSETVDVVISESSVDRR
jgi:hypothetical protein